MLLKPIPPARYNGEANAKAIQRFARESRTYVKMGRVPEDEHVYFVLYYLDGKALDFYNQIVVPDEDNWTLKHFFVELFEFCFPVDFRNNQRKRLNRSFQNGKEVAEHVAEWSEIYNTIGLEDNQEKNVKLFGSFTFAIQTEMYRKDLDPEVATWDEIVKAAELSEILLKIDAKNRRDKHRDSGANTEKRPQQNERPNNHRTNTSNQSRGSFRGCSRGNE
jgi:hypothetical protein